MFFKNKFREICNVLDGKYQGMKRPNQNAADIGQLCELFAGKSWNKLWATCTGSNSAARS
jgi:hypothetical protein